MKLGNLGRQTSAMLVEIRSKALPVGLSQKEDEHVTQKAMPRW